MHADEIHRKLLYTRGALAGAIALTMYTLWQRMPEVTASRIIFYLVVLFPYAFLAMTLRDPSDRRLLNLVLGGTLLFMGLWIWALLAGPADGPSTPLAVILHIILGAVVGIPAVILGKRARRAA